jgi:uncharacterized membrane protein
MARILLWMIISMGFITIIVDHFTDTHTDVYTKIVVISCVSVMALCEAIRECKGK